MVKPNKMVICMGDDWAELTALTEKLTLFFRTHQNVNMINPVNLLNAFAFSSLINCQPKIAINIKYNKNHQP